MHEHELERRAIDEVVRIEPYDLEWLARFEAERGRLCVLAPELLAIEHVGSTAVPGLAAKPIIDLIAAVASLDVADGVVARLCANGYVSSAEFNRGLGDRRWLMRHSAGRRTHHLHLVLDGSAHWVERVRFRDLLRGDGALAQQYATLKRRLADTFGGDREGYGDAKTAFIAAALKRSQ